MENGAEKKLEEKVSNMDSTYLIYHVGKPLAKALAEIVQKQPSDPIEYLSCWLHKYEEYQLELKKEKESIKLMMEAEIGRMQKMACIEEEKLLVRQKRKELIEQKLRERQKLEEMNKRQRELEEARNRNLQSPEKKDEKGRTALHRIAAELDADFTHLDKMPLLLAERDVEFRTPREIARQMGLDANVAEIDKYVFSLLEKGEISVLKYLLLNSYEHFQPALDLKLETTLLPDTSTMFVNSISDVQEKITYLFSLIQEGDDEATEKLLESQPQLASCKNNYGHSLLHVAILCDNIPAVKHILDINPDGINMTDNLNRTPLHYAFALSETITEILLENKAMDSLLDLMQKSPADYKADPSAIQKLKERYTNSLPPAEPESVVPPAEPESVVPSAQPESVVLAAEPESVVPPAQPESVVPSAQPESVVPPAQPESVVPPAQPESVVPPAQPESVVPPAQPESVVPPAQTESLEPPAEPTSLEPPAEPASLEPPAEPASLEPPAEPASLEPPAEPVSLEPPAEPESLVPPAEPESLVPPAEPESLVPIAEPESLVPPAEPVSMEPPAEPVSLEPPAEPESVEPPAQPESLEPPEPVLNISEETIKEEAEDLEAAPPSENPES